MQNRRGRSSSSKEYVLFVGSKAMDRTPSTSSSLGVAATLAWFHGVVGRGQPNRTSWLVSRGSVIGGLLDRFRLGQDYGVDISL